MAKLQSVKRRLEFSRYNFRSSQVGIFRSIGGPFRREDDALQVFRPTWLTNLRPRVATGTGTFFGRHAPPHRDDATVRKMSQSPAAARLARMAGPLGRAEQEPCPGKSAT